MFQVSPPASMCPCSRLTRYVGAQYLNRYFFSRTHECDSYFFSRTHECDSHECEHVMCNISNPASPESKHRGGENSSRSIYHQGRPDWKYLVLGHTSCVQGHESVVNYTRISRNATRSPTPTIFCFFFPTFQGAPASVHVLGAFRHAVRLGVAIGCRVGVSRPVKRPEGPHLDKN